MKHKGVNMTDEAKNKPVAALATALDRVCYELNLFERRPNARLLSIRMKGSL